ncbi:hypothetical protein CA85_15980 [Allorhodopirellula solitaria]|uniref:Uncharacterized protein n=1 Tax=Allorhodopirellula solitaria TaxID=2527987 RepID=A0A5C5YF43_9BACT|nr:hypothetical protein CA85_15980 [Allorhodopirellula solitaria]
MDMFFNSLAREGQTPFRIGSKKKSVKATAVGGVDAALKPYQTPANCSTGGYCEKGCKIAGNWR